MTITLDNTLAGEPGTQVSNTTLAASGTVGSLTVADPGRASYTDTQTVYSLPTVQVRSGHHRFETTRLYTVLPEGAWAARFYLHTPSLQAAGHGTNEVRWVARIGSTGITVREAADHVYQVRAQPSDLAAAVVSHSFAGPGLPFEGTVRLEIRYDGTDTVCRGYVGHDTTLRGTWTWAGQAFGPALALTGYRYRSRPTLYWGDQGTAVAELQTELITLGYDLGEARADGDFGNLTLAAVESFQSSRGLSPVDGIPGPETRAAMDLALGHVPPPLYLSHLAVSDGEWIGPAAPPPAPTTPRALRPGPLPI